MTRFERVQPNAQETQIFRDALLAQPPEFFRAYFGFVPDMLQKIFLVEKLLGSMAAPKMYMNDLYRVQVREVAPFVQLDITRRDGEVCSNWQDFQKIKNELVGPECEGVELFPAESRLVDTANQYHLWVMPNTRYRFPFGFENRLVLHDPVLYGTKAVQRGTGLPGAVPELTPVASPH